MKTQKERKRHVINIGRRRIRCADLECCRLPEAISGRMPGYHRSTVTLTTRDMGKIESTFWNRARTVLRWELFYAARLAIDRAPRRRSNESQTHDGIWWREMNHVLSTRSIWLTVERLFQLLMTRRGPSVVCLSTVFGKFLLTPSTSSRGRKPCKTGENRYNQFYSLITIYPTKQTFDNLHSLHASYMCMLNHWLQWDK